MEKPMFTVRAPGRSLGAAALVGIGLMAGVDEIIFHQLLQWHHFFDRSTPVVGLLSDGLLHAAELMAIVAGFFLLLNLRRDRALVLLLGAGCAYSLATARQRQRGKRWSRWRTLSFWLGIGVLMVAVWPTTMEYAHRDFRGHMLQHLLIGMLAPLGLVLASPISLLLRSLPKTTGRAISRFMHSRPLQWVSSPWVAMVLNMGAMYVLYLTPLYAASLHHSVLHYWLHVHFLAAGYLFTWAILGGLIRVSGVTHYRPGWVFCGCRLPVTPCWRSSCMASVGPGAAPTAWRRFKRRPSGCITGAMQRSFYW